MAESEIQVVKSEQFGTYRQTIRPATQEQIPAIVDALHKILRLKRFTGVITEHWNQGGVRTL